MEPLIGQVYSLDAAGFLKYHNRDCRFIVNQALDISEWDIYCWITRIPLREMEEGGIGNVNYLRTY